MPDVHRCRAGERERALATVVDAFASDPLLRWVWPAQTRYDACGRAFFGLLLDLRLAGGEVWTADGGDAVAMWDPPGGLYVDAPDGAWARVQASFTAEERRKWETYDRSMAVPADAGPYWYLGVLATAPARQGVGLGRAVMAPMLAGADRTGLPTFLETAAEANLRFYQHLAFGEVLDMTMPGGPQCWLMRREPQPGSTT